MASIKSAKFYGEDPKKNRIEVKGSGFKNNGSVHDAEVTYGALDSLAGIFAVTGNPLSYGVQVLGFDAWDAGNVKVRVRTSAGGWTEWANVTK